MIWVKLVLMTPNHHWTAIKHYQNFASPSSRSNYYLYHSPMTPLPPSTTPYSQNVPLSHGYKAHSLLLQRTQEDPFLPPISMFPPRTQGATPRLLYAKKMTHAWEGESSFITKPQMITTLLAVNNNLFVYSMVSTTWCTVIMEFAHFSMQLTLSLISVWIEIS